MDMSNLTTLTREEIIKRLAERGIKEGIDTPRFYQSICQGFEPVDGMPGRYVERDDWQDESSSSTSDQQTMHH